MAPPAPTTSGAPPEERLAAVELALAHPDGTDATRRALRLHRIDALVAAGRLERAHEAGLELTREGLDDRSLWTTLAGAALARGDCALAAPWLERLEADGDDAAAAHLARCRASGPK